MVFTPGQAHTLSTTEKCVTSSHTCWYCTPCGNNGKKDFVFNKERKEGGVRIREGSGNEE